ncbi:MAG: putative toxin-antitoxin system toxin component, family [Mucilaginibacter sp.]|nr:putative toxin-antitoxin system toxin component, family [Mucilaginibacter sp.]
MKNDLAVIDTNIFVSSLISTIGYSKKIFEDLILTGKIKICISNDVFDEYSEVLLRDRFKKYPGFANASIILLDRIKKHGLWFEPKLKIDVLDDKDDNKFIELAVEAQAAYIVTGNSNDFILKSYEGISICSPKEFYEFQSMV